MCFTYYTNLPNRVFRLLALLVLVLVNQYKNGIIDRDFKALLQVTPDKNAFHMPYMQI